MSLPSRVLGLESARVGEGAGTRWAKWSTIRRRLGGEVRADCNSGSRVIRGLRRMFASGREGWRYGRPGVSLACPVHVVLSAILVFGRNPRVLALRPWFFLSLRTGSGRRLGEGLEASRSAAPGGRGGGGRPRKKDKAGGLQGAAPRKVGSRPEPRGAVPR